MPLHKQANPPSIHVLENSIRSKLCIQTPNPTSHPGIISAMVPTTAFKVPGPSIIHSPLLNQSPNILLHPSLTLFSYSSLCSLHIFAASTFAGLSSFGSANMLITLINIFSTL